MLSFDPDRSPPAPVDAATLILVRDRGALEVFLIRRSARSPFLGGAVVFPGGKLDSHDLGVTRTNGLVPETASARRYAESPELALALAVCACRESLEEAGILPVTRSIAPAARESLRRRLVAGEGLDAALAAHHAEVLVDTLSLIPFARWITPEAEARRFDARFFLAAVPTGQEGLVDQHEAVASVWTTPRRMLDAFHRGDVFLAPPTLRALELLTEVSKVDAAVDLARRQSVLPICPRFVPGDPTLLAIPGDPLHPESEPRVSGGTRFVLRDGRFVSEWPPEQRDEPQRDEPSPSR
ncbi:MAG: hypothetical protein FJ096_06280 [Deltaproteobacteria bacterium]|nr:hypothetical protein [Deltaproteobacteria bacterium]